MNVPIGLKKQRTSYNCSRALRFRFTEPNNIELSLYYAVPYKPWTLRLVNMNESVSSVQNVHNALNKYIIFIYTIWLCIRYLLKLLRRTKFVSM